VLYRQALGEVLREIRTDKGKTLTSLSPYLSVAHLSELERGKNEVSSEVLETIANGLGTSVSEIVILAGWKMNDHSTRLDKLLTSPYAGLTKQLR
jgi:transcriptional regulator with XRE-family HTH domain